LLIPTIDSTRAEYII
jgi:dynein heavy chain